MSKNQFKYCWGDRAFTYKELLQTMIICCGDSVSPAYLALFEERLDLVFLHVDTYLDLQQQRRIEAENTKAKQKLKDFGMSDAEIEEAFS